MTETLYLLIIIFGMSIQNVLKKAFNKKLPSGGVMIFSATTVLFATLFFAVTASYPLCFTADMLPFALGFAACYCASAIFSILAINCGSLSLTSLAISYSLLIPTVFGLLFWGDEPTPFFFIGLAFLIVSLLLINSKDGEIKITPKWALFVLIAFLGNGLCSTIQNGYAKLHSTGNSEFMLIALFAVFVAMLTMSIFRERPLLSPSLKGGWYFMAICGIANGAVNLFVILLSPRMDSSIMFPLISAGGIVLTSLVSILLYKERLSLKQYIGMALGIAAIVFLNL